MMNNEDEVVIKNAISSHLDAQVDNLDYNTSSRLSAARHRALAGERRQPRLRMPQWQLLAGGGLCAASLLVFMITRTALDSGNVQAPQVAVIGTGVDSMALSEPAQIIEDLQLLSATDDIEFYQSVDFLEWLEENSG